MVVEHAERFGLSQLHQLRGRVGRGAHQSYCILLYQSPLTDQGRERLKAMTETTDGFVIAERDLELRGPGDFFGTRQSGMPTLRVGDLAARSSADGGGAARSRRRPRRRRRIGDADGARAIRAGSSGSGWSESDDAVSGRRSGRQSGRQSRGAGEADREASASAERDPRI